MILCAGAERSGKSAWAGYEILGRLPWCRRVAIAAQEYDESRAEMEYIIDGLDRLGGLESKSTPKTGKWIARARGGIELETISLHDGPEELTGRGKPFDIVALVEAGRIRYDAFLRARGRVAEVRGIVLLSGTLWDTYGWYADLYQSFAGPNVFQGERFSFPAWSNLAIYPGGRNDPEIARLKAIYPDDEFARLVGAELRPSPARLYPEFEYAQHVAEIAFDPELPVELAVDAGYFPSKYAVLAIQVVPEQWTIDGGVAEVDVVRVIDEVWENYLTHHDVYSLVTQRPWWPNVNRILLGHEGKQHQAAESTQEVWQTLAVQDPSSRRVVPRPHLPGRRHEPEREFVVPVDVFDAGRILDGVLRVKTVLVDPRTKRPRLRIAPHCAGLQHEFQVYHRKSDSRGNVVSDEPVDKDNDALDALRNWLVERYGLVDFQREQRPTKPRPRPRG